VFEEAPVRPQKPGQARCADVIGADRMRSSRVLRRSKNPFEMTIGLTRQPTPAVTDHNASIIELSEILVVAQDTALGPVNK